MLFIRSKKIRKFSWNSSNQYKWQINFWRSPGWNSIDRIKEKFNKPKILKLVEFQKDTWAFDTKHGNRRI